MKISEIITDKYKLRIPPTVYYELLADVVEVEEEQELCDDAISRKDAKISLVQFMRNQKSLCECIDDCSSVQPKVKTGRWRPNFRFGMYYDEKFYICSECNKQSMEHSSYCPNCGARMVEPQESEDKECGKQY